MTVYVFAGPSVPRRLRVHIASYAVVLPPVAAGDLLRLEAAPGDTVAIIDGFFHQRPAVRHKEVLHLLASGVAVHGAASMGALRAAELAPFGMVGHGRVFRDYRCGALTADDEVALLHGTESEDYEPYTEALVNVRYALRDAVRSGVLGRQAADTALACAGRVPFVERTRPVLLEAAGRHGLSEAECAAYAEVMRTARDIKREDATNMLRTLRGPRGAAPRGPNKPQWRLHRSTFLTNWQADARGVDDPEFGFIPHRRVHEICQILGEDYPDFREQTAVRALAADHQPHTPADHLPEAALARLRDMGILRPGAENHPGLDRWCTTAERRLPPVQRTLKAASRALFTESSLSLDDPFIAALNACGAYDVAREHVRRCLRYHRALRVRHPELRPSMLRADRIVSWYAERWNTDDIDDAILERGFTSLDHFISCARRYYLYDKAEPNAARLTLGIECTP